MNKYFEELDEIVKQYFKVLSDEIPDFLYDYINTPEMRENRKNRMCLWNRLYTNI